MFSTKYWTFFLVVIAAIGYSMYKSSQPASLITSPSDPYSYQYLELDNQLKVLLVQTPGLDKAGAALSVDVGSMDNPAGREGLAHFLEHMLFLGTEPYPEADEYQQFISQNGGSHNAFTSYKQTTYFFDIDKDQLTGALDRFAPFFISPTFDENYVDREKNAVHAEYKANFREDSRRIFSAEKLAMNTEFGYSTFSTGSLDTLSDKEGSSIRDELIEFYQEHYSSDRMSLVITGDYPLEELAQMATARFADIPLIEHDFTRPDVPVFAPEQLPMDMHIKPIKEIRRLQFTFPMPESTSTYAYKPVAFLANLIGHEGEGSVLSLLKEKGWAESLSAGRGLSTEHASTLNVSINLTREGLKHKEEVTHVLMGYLTLLNDNPLPDYLKEEEQQLSKMAFQFQEHGQISQYAIQLSSNMLILPTEDLIYGSYRADKPSNELLAPYIAALNPSNMLRTLVAPDVETDRTDPWYDTEILTRASQYRDDQVVDGLDQLHLPEPNPFIPENLAITPDAEQSTPSALISQAERQVWYYPEQDFKLPKTQVISRFYLPELSQDAKSQVIASLYTRAVNEALNSYSYPAYLAGLKYNLRATDQGLEIQLGGYQDKLPELLESVLGEMQQLNVSPEEFERYQASLKRSLENSLKGRPFRRTIAELKDQITQQFYSDTELLEQVDAVTLGDIETYANQLTQQVANLTYIHGALSAEQALALAELIEKTFPTNVAIPPQSAIVKLPQGQFQTGIELEHQDKVFTLYIQGDDTSDKARAEMGLLAQMLSSPYYNYMRTEQQLGYIVFAAAYPQKSVPGLIFIVQSPEASPQVMMDKSNTFFTDYQSTLADTSAEEFALYQEGLITKLLEKPKNMGEKARQYWSDLVQGRTDFNASQAIADQVKLTDKTSIETLYQKAILNPELSWLLVRKGDAVEGLTDIAEMDTDRLAQFPLLQPGSQPDTELDTEETNP